MKIKKAKPTLPDKPWLFRHQYGTIMVYAPYQKQAVKQALGYARGMPVVLDTDHAKRVVNAGR